MELYVQHIDRWETKEIGRDRKKRSAERKRIIEKGYVAEAAVAAAAAATVAVKKN